MKEKIIRALERIKAFIVKFLYDARDYFKHNVLFVSFVILSLIEGSLLRFFTVKNFFSISPVLADASVILLVGAFGYLLKPKHRFKYYMFWSIVFTLVCVIN